MSYQADSPRWRRYLRFLRPDIDRDVDDELRFHFDSRIEELVARGLTPDDARDQALREFGDVREISRGLRTIDHRVAARRGRAEGIRDLVGDIRYAVRSLRRAPGVAVAILATLSLGVGANAAMFSLVETLFLRPPAGVASPEGIRRLWTEVHFQNGTQFWPGFAYPQFVAVNEVVGDRATVALYTSPRTAKIGRGESASKAQVSFASTAYLKLTGAHAALGRLYSPDEDRLDTPAPVAVISRRYWTRALNSDASVIGQPLFIDGRKHTIVGVVAEPFTGVDLDAVDVWTPLAFNAAGRGTANAWWKASRVNGFAMLIRPRPGVSEAELEQRITTTLRRPTADRGNRDSATVARFGSIVLANGPGKKSQEIGIAIRLAGVAAIVLLIACANVVNLLLARAIRRRREIAVRLALGIARERLIRLLLTETAVLAAGAAFVALFVAYIGGSLLRGLLLPDIHWAVSPLNLRVAGFAFAVALLFGLLAGILPALQAARPDLTVALKASSRTGTSQRSRLQSGLVAAQAALSAVLIAGALLFVRSLANVRQVDIGFDAARSVAASVSYDDRSVYRDPTFSQRLASIAARAASIPGVQHVGLASARPLESMSWLPFRTETDSMRSDFAPTITGVSAGYFAAAGLRILRGTDFPTSSSQTPSVVVNETMARMGWPGRDAIGECMYFDSRAAGCYRVVGVVENSRETRIIEEDTPKYYVSLDHVPESGAKFVRPSEIIMSVEPARAAAATAVVRNLIRQEFPGGIPSITRLSDYLEPQYRPWRLGATLFTAFGVLALVVAVVGIYSTVAYRVSQRTHEFGVRIALGARLGDVLRLVVGEGLRPVAVGVGVGIVLALAAGKLVTSLLYGVKPGDPGSLVGVAAILLSVGVLAALVPAWRAGRVDPVTALRAD